MMTRTNVPMPPGLLRLVEPRQHRNYTSINLGINDRQADRTNQRGSVSPFTWRFKVTEVRH